MMAALTREDKQDLARYRELYKQEPMKFWRSAIEYLENGKERKLTPDQQRALTRVKSLLDQGHSVMSIYRDEGITVSYSTIHKMSGNQPYAVSDEACRRLVDQLDRVFPEQRIKAEAS